MSADDRTCDLAASYALGALEADELCEFEDHLQGCPACRREVDALRAVTGLLAYGVAAQEPPAALRETILARARAEAAERAPDAGDVEPARGAERAPVDDRVPRDPAAVRAEDTPVPRAAPPASRWLLPAATLAAAASLVLAVVTTLGYLGERATRAQTEATLADALGELAQRDALLGAFLSDDVSAARLTSTGADPSIRLFWNRDQSVVAVAAFNLPPAADGRVYQLWGIPTGQSPVSLGTFNTETSGSAVVLLPVPAGVDLQDSDLSAVTDEPAGGSPQPTTTPFLVGPWEHAQ